MPVNSTDVPGGRGRGVPLVLLSVYLFVFLGGGAFQYYVKEVVPRDWSALKVSSIIGMLYLSLLLWRFLIVHSQYALGDKWCFTLGALCYIAVPAAAIFTTNYLVLLAMAFLWGWGGAALWQTGLVWLYDATNPRRRGLWSGIIYMVTFLALTIGVKVMAAAASAHNARAILALAVIPGALAGLAGLFLPARSPRAQRFSISAAMNSLADRRLLLLGLLLFAASTSSGLLLGALRDSMESSYGAAFLGNVLAFHFVVRLVVSIVGGHSTDAFARRNVLALVLLAGGIGLAAAGLFESKAILVLAVGGLGAIGMIVGISTAALSADWFTPEKRGLAIASSFVWSDFGIAASVMGGQFLVDATGGVRGPMMIFAVTFILAAGLAMLLPAHAAATTGATGETGAAAADSKLAAEPGGASGEA